MTVKPVIFTDLDGTLLDSEYSCRSALPVIDRIKKDSIPLVPVTSKTRAEVESILAGLGIKGPFITENGGGVYIPEGSMPFPVKGEREDGARVIRLGVGYDEIRAAFDDIRKKTGFRMTGFADITPEEINVRTGLPIEQARLAKARDFDEAFFLDSGSVEEVAPLAFARGLRVTRGRILHMTGQNDKGKATEILKSVYRAAFGKIVTIGLGDAENDIPLLKSVDYPVLVKNREGAYERVEGIQSLIKADGVGPEGWAKALTGILDSIEGSGRYTC